MRPIGVIADVALEKTEMKRKRVEAFSCVREKEKGTNLSKRHGNFLPAV